MGRTGNHTPIEKEHFKMNYRNLGKTGLKVSMVGLGCNNFGGRIDLEASRLVVEKSIDLGITLFDTADVYGNRGGSEEILGQTLGKRRHSVVLATKFASQLDDAGFLQGGSRRYIVMAAEDSLRRLKTDWIDLYQMHRPDPDTPIDETLSALDDLVRQGKVRYIGCSNFAAWQTVEAMWNSRFHNLKSFASCQNQYSLLAREIDKELIGVMQSYGIELLPYFPLASGMLSGKYKQNEPLPEGARITNSQGMQDRYFTPANWKIVVDLTEFATKRGKTLLELAFSWLGCRPTVSSVIAGHQTRTGRAQRPRRRLAIDAGGDGRGG